MEQLIILSIVGILIVPLSRLILVEEKIYESEMDRIEVNYQAQISMDSFIEKAINASGVKNVYNENRKKMNTTKDKIEISKIVFYNIDSNIVIEYKNKGLWYGFEPRAKVVFSDKIDYLKLKPVHSDFGNCDGLEIEIQASKGDEKVVIDNKFFFRNANN